MGKKYAFASSLIYFIVVCIFVTVRMLSQFGVFSFMGEAGNYIVNGVLQVGILLVFSFLMFKYLTKRSFKKTLNNFSYTKISWRIILISIGLGVVVYFLNIFISAFFQSILFGLGYHSPNYGTSNSGTITSLILGLIFTAIIPAVCEENIHRGMLLFGNTGLGMKNNILLTGLMFGLLHMNIEQFFYATIIGMFLNFVLYVSESIYPCMIIHFMNNGISVVMSYLISSGKSTGGFLSYLSSLTSQNALIGFLTMFLTVVVLLICLFYLIKLLVKYSFEDKFRDKQKAVQDLAAKVNFYNDLEKKKNSDNLNAENAQDDVITFGDKQLIFMSFDEIKDFVKNNPDVPVPKPKKEKMETRTKVLLIMSIVLMSAVTLFSFIWGL